MKNSNPHKTITSKYIVSTIALSSLLLTISGCNSRLVNSKPTQSTVIDNTISYTSADESASTAEGITQVITANNQFAVSMYQQINRQSKPANDNVFFSPYSLSTAMAMLYAAAEGETKQQIQQTFYYPSMDILNPNSAALYNQFNRPNPDYKLATVNDLWLKQGLRPNKAYVDTVQRYYGGQVTALDFEANPNPARQTINKKIAKHTNQMIPALLPMGSITSDTVTVLTNAIYFKGDWKIPFTVQSTRDQTFYNHLGTTSDVKMMHLQSRFAYTEDKQAQVVQLPYKGDDLSMLVVLPKSKDKLAMQQLVTDLSTTKIKQWDAALVKQQVNLHLPKFKLEERYQMKKLLSDMGMPKAFERDAQFNVFDDNSTINVDDVYHQAVVEVDETGTEAAAATGIVAVVTSMPANPPVEFKADHPFMFVIKDNKTDAILFLGQVNQP